MADERLLAVFADAARAAHAIAALRGRGLARIEVFSPVPDRAIEYALASRTSPVRAFTLAGGVLGCASGLALTVWTSLRWPLMTGGKPIVSLPAFLIIAFELTILFGALAALLGFLVEAKLPRRVPAPYDARFSEDRYGVLVTTTPDDSGAARELLSAAGAEEVRSA